jgi:hypothetical protein
MHRRQPDGAGKAEKLVGHIKNRPQKPASAPQPAMAAPEQPAASLKCLIYRQSSAY